MKYTIPVSIALFALQSSAHPTVVQERGVERRSIDISKFRLKTSAQYVDNKEAVTIPTIANLKRADYVSTATALVKKTVPGATFRVVNDHYVGTNGVAHVHFKQTANGIDIDNADFNVNIAKDGSVFSFGNSFYKGAVPANPLKKRAFRSPVEGLKGAIATLGLPIAADKAVAKAEGAETYTFTGTSGAEKDPKARLVYFAEDGKLSLTWRVETDILTNWLLTYAKADSTEEVVGVVDYAADATYQVYPWGVNDPTVGSRVTVTDPWGTAQSEFTWQGESATTQYTSTRGNNGIAQTNPSGGTSYLNNPRPSSSTLDFVYPYSPATTDYKSYANASTTQLFYTANFYHDLLHLLGFNEKAGNFETNNNGQGGVGNDAVILNAQDGSGTNNANFATPPDGQPGRMRMYIWTTSTPNRDGSMEAGIVIHEYTHGVSNRLTGGPSNSGCLSTTEAGGMGEGWGDFMATAIRSKTTDTRATNYGMGNWASGQTAAGIRAYPYSTSLTTNPLTYKSVNSLSAVHAIGTVWATILYEVMWNLIDQYGITSAAKPTLNTKGAPSDGRHLAMKLVLDGMALQPCNPDFVSARNAIIDADTALTGGANKCLLWKAFAKRGLGNGASRGTGNARVESYTLPSGC